jgi:phage tail sheath protein FI
VPAFLGFTQKVPEDGEGNKQFHTPHRLTLWPQFEETFGTFLATGYLAYAVRGFFENGGGVCYVVSLSDTALPADALRLGLQALAPLDTLDLICAPDIMRPRQPGALALDPVAVRTMQVEVLTHCDTLGDRFALLDALPRAAVSEVLQHRQGLSGTNGALYYPWVRVPGGPAATRGFVPPCGHVAGVYARSDQGRGIHQAPANEVLEGVLDLESNLTSVEQDQLNPAGVNCVRAFPGRGIRVWGARTLSHQAAWRYVNVRRLFLTAGRWVERNMHGVVFEPHTPTLWARIVRELTAYCMDLLRRGALKGRTPQEAFYVKCDAETNPLEVCEEGLVITEIGLAPVMPSEFVIVRLIHGASGVTISGPAAG